MTTPCTRRSFIARSAAACAAALAAPGCASLSGRHAELDFPLVDFHVHLDKSTIDAVLALPQARHIKFGIVEHAGTKENEYPVVLSNDAELKQQLAMLAGKPVYRGVQTEFSDWATGFTQDGLAQLDYILTDAMTMPGKNGKRTKLWLAPAAELGDAQTFMDRYVDWHLQVLQQKPLDILANVTWLPSIFLPDYDRLWTDARMEKVIAAAVNAGVALEISSSYKLPKMPFLKMAKAAGVKFTFGSNGRYPKMGLLDHSIQTAQELGLKRADMFVIRAERKA
jgi:histidinol phosphatase-like PHP family hydrolase